MALTASEIGRRVGCSTATVSRALNNSGSVSAKTREAILRAAREVKAIQPTPGKAARAGRSAIKSGLIEVVYHRHSPFERVQVQADGISVGPLSEAPEKSISNRGRFELAHAFYRDLVDAAIAEAAKWHRRATLQLNQDLCDEDFLAELNQTDRAGVLLVGEPSDRLGEFIARCSHPLVLVDIAYDSWPDVVTTDNLPGISIAFDHIYGLGHRKIGFVGRQQSNFAFAERYLGFRFKMAEAGLAIREDWVFDGYSHVAPAVEGVKAILSKEDRPTALICSNDCVAMGAIRAAAELGLRVPQDVSIIGFDDADAAAMVTPPLTTIHVPTAEIGRQAVRQLMLQIQAGVSTSSRGTRIRLTPELVVRRSTAAWQSAAQQVMSADT